MKKLAVMAVFGLVIALCAATVSVGSVVSRDTGVDKNRVVIDVSGSARYSVQPLSGGTVHRIVIPDATSSGGKPDYKRLSPVIDRISTYKEGSNTVVEVRTMDAVDVSHSLQNGKIVLNISKTGDQPVVKTQETAPRKVYTPPADPIPPTRYYDAPQEIASITVRPSKTKVQKPLLPEVLKPDSSAAAPEVKQFFPATSEIDSLLPPQALDEEMPQKAEAGSGAMNFVKKYWYWLAGALLLILLLIILRPRAKEDDKHDDLKGTTLVLDEETKNRMVMKLLKEGWKSTEIAKELNLPIKEVEHVISLAHLSGGMEDHH